MKPIICNGWALFFHPLFFAQWSDLVEEVKELKVKKEKGDFITHPSVKLLKAIDVGIKEKIPIDPFASYFILKKTATKIRSSQKNGTTQSNQSIL